MISGVKKAEQVKNSEPGFFRSGSEFFADPLQKEVHTVLLLFSEKTDSNFKKVWYNIKKSTEGECMQIAICDDSLADTQFVQNIAQAWAADRKLSTEIETFTSAESFLFHYAEKKDYDILLLDVEMGRMDGVALAKKIRRENQTVQIVFITGYSDYIAEGYEVEALHYLMKPVKRDKLFTVLDRAAEKVRQNENVLKLELSGEMVRLPMHEIRYLDVQKNYVTVHGKQDYTVKRSLGDFEAELDDRFFRAGRGLILNLKVISRVTKQEVHLSDGTVLSLPRGGYESLNRAIIERT